MRLNYKYVMPQQTLRIFAAEGEKIQNKFQSPRLLLVESIWLKSNVQLATRREYLMLVRRTSSAIALLKRKLFSSEKVSEYLLLPEGDDIKQQSEFRRSIFDCLRQRNMQKILSPGRKNFDRRALFYHLATTGSNNIFEKEDSTSNKKMKTKPSKTYCLLRRERNTCKLISDENINESKSILKNTLLQVMSLHENPAMHLRLYQPDRR